MFGSLRPSPEQRALSILRQNEGEVMTFPFRLNPAKHYVIFKETPLCGLGIVAFPSEEKEFAAIVALRSAFVAENRPLATLPVTRSFGLLHQIVTGPIFDEQGVMLDLLPPTHSRPSGGIAIYARDEANASPYRIWLPGGEESILALAEEYEQLSGSPLFWGWRP